MNGAVGGQGARIKITDKERRKFRGVGEEGEDVE